MNVPLRKAAGKVLSRYALVWYSQVGRMLSCCSLSTA